MWKLCALLLWYWRYFYVIIWFHCCFGIIIFTVLLFSIFRSTISDSDLLVSLDEIWVDTLTRQDIVDVELRLGNGMKVEGIRLSGAFSYLDWVWRVMPAIEASFSWLKFSLLLSSFSLAAIDKEKFICRLSSVSNDYRFWNTICNQMNTINSYKICNKRL